MDRGAWWATVHGVAQNRTRLRDFHFHLSENQGLADQAPPLPSPASHHRFCPSHNDPAWPVSLEHHALSHFLTVLCPPAPVFLGFQASAAFTHQPTGR